MGSHAGGVGVGGPDKPAYAGHIIQGNFWAVKVICFISSFSDLIFSSQ